MKTRRSVTALGVVTRLRAFERDEEDYNYYKTSSSPMPRTFFALIVIFTSMKVCAI